MTSYHASNDYGIFHFVMDQPPDMTIIIVAVTCVMTILVGAYLIWKYIPAPHQ